MYHSLRIQQSVSSSTEYILPLCRTSAKKLADKCYIVTAAHRGGEMKLLQVRHLGNKRRHGRHQESTRSRKRLGQHSDPDFPIIMGRVTSLPQPRTCNDETSAANAAATALVF
jgi:hypothetical protein